MPDEQHMERVAIVTGAARGIGRAIAERLLADGHRVAIVDRDGPAANATAQALGERAQAIICDITDAAAVNAMVWHIHATWGRVDVLVNNAGIVGPNKCSRTSPMRSGRGCSRSTSPARSTVAAPPCRR